eukprot:9418502-Ditylum_brightwellii.AAC.1
MEHASVCANEVDKCFASQFPGVASRHPWVAEVKLSMDIMKIFSEMFQPFTFQVIEKPAKALAYHPMHVSILGTNHVGATRRDALKRRMTCKDIKCKRDYAE